MENLTEKDIRDFLRGTEYGKVLLYGDDLPCLYRYSYLPDTEKAKIEQHERYDLLFEENSGQVCPGAGKAYGGTDNLEGTWDGWYDEWNESGCGDGCGWAVSSGQQEYAHKCECELEGVYGFNVPLDGIVELNGEKVYPVLRKYIYRNTSTSLLMKFTSIKGDVAQGFRLRPDLSLEPWTVVKTANTAIFADANKLTDAMSLLDVILHEEQNGAEKMEAAIEHYKKTGIFPEKWHSD